MDNKTITHILNKLCHKWHDKYYITRTFEYKDGVHIVLFNKHWIVIYVKDPIVDFFDSFGRNPIHFNLRFKNKHVNIYSKNVQDKNSLTCGYYCIAYVYMKMCNMLDCYFQIFTKDKIMNDKKIIHLVHNLIKNS